MKVKSLSKLPRRKVTVDDLLGADSVVDILNDLHGERHDLEELVVIYTSAKRKDIVYSTNGMADNHIIYLLEAVKHCILDGC